MNEVLVDEKIVFAISERVWHSLINCAFWFGVSSPVYLMIIYFIEKVSKFDS